MMNYVWLLMIWASGFVCGAVVMMELMRAASMPDVAEHKAVRSNLRL